jgi:hypothetical protein
MYLIFIIEVCSNNGGEKGNVIMEKIEEYNNDANI